MESDREPTVTNSLERALALLELLEHTPGGLRNAEISRELKIPRSTCSYIARRLEQKGYLSREEDTLRYQIGLKTVALAHGALRELGFRTMAEPVLYRLASDTGMSAGIGVLQQGRVLLVDRVEGPEFVREVVHRKIPRGRTREQRDMGRELNVHTTALGKVLLAYLPEGQRAELLRGLVLVRRTARTIVSKAKLMAELAEVRRQGYATADEEEYVGVRSLGAPIYDSRRKVRAAVALNGGLADPAWNDAPAMVDLIQNAATEISKRSRLA